MTLLSLEELSQELSVPLDVIKEMINKKVITPYGGKARLGEPQFSRNSLSHIRDKIVHFNTR